MNRIEKYLKVSQKAILTCLEFALPAALNISSNRNKRFLMLDA